jgi:hypothetical protein
MFNIAKIMNKTGKTTASTPILSIMPLKGYMARIVDRRERIRVKDSLMEAMGIHSDMSWWRFVVGCSHRPSYEQREAAAEVMRHYMQNASITGEDLFPEYLYPVVS